MIAAFQTYLDSSKSNYFFLRDFENFSHRILMTIVTTVHDTVSSPYRWMDQKISVRTDSVLYRGDLLEAKLYAEISALASKRDSPDLQIVVGRIVSETNEDLKDMKVPFNDHSLVIEPVTGSIASKKRRMRFFIHEAPQYVLFIGQIVAAIGRVTNTGKDFHADTILCGPSAPPPQAVVVDNAPTAPIHVTFASGPYSPDNMLIFDSLGELESRVRDNPPDVLVVTGPFLDVNHPQIASGMTYDSFNRPVTFDDIYKEEIIPKLARLARSCENAKTELIIVPSTNEARFDFPIPQPPLNQSSESVWELLVRELPKSVKFHSNPCTLILGDTRILLTSADALSVINSNVLFKQGEGQLGRVDACLDQIIRSRSLFPVMPNNLRIDHASRHLADIRDDNIPHIVVSPSLAGKRFIKNINGRVFVNPGFMSDPPGTTSSLAEIVIGPPAGDPNDICARVTGNLVKL